MTATVKQIRRGSAAENDAFTGAIGEVTMDTTNKTLRVHDGETLGGTKLAKQSEIPTAQNIFNSIMPSENYENLTLLSSGSIYTAPANGYYYLRMFSSRNAAEFINVMNLDKNFFLSVTNDGNIDWAKGPGLMPVSAGDKVQISYTFSGNVEVFKFIYAGN